MSVFLSQCLDASGGSCYKGYTTNRKKIDPEKFKTPVIQWAKCYKISQQEFWNQYQNTPSNIKCIYIRLGLTVLLYLHTENFVLDILGRSF